MTTPPQVQDALSALYYLRLLPLETGKSLQLPVHSGGRNLELQVEVIARERIATPFGPRVAFKVEPRSRGAQASRACSTTVAGSSCGSPTTPDACRC